MNDVFFAPESKQLTIAIQNASDVSVTHESDGTILVSVENIGEIEFFTEDAPVWRAVK